MIINHSQKYIYIAVPRTASTAISVTLGDTKHPEPHLHHMSIANILQNYPQCKDYYKFAFVRHPLDRLVSLYHDFIQTRKKWYSETVYTNQLLFSEFKNFEDFCLRVFDSSWVNDTFFKTQYEILSINNHLMMDYIGKFENLQESFNQICLRIGIPPRHINVHRPTKHNHYSTYYTPQTIKIVRQYYSKDFEEFNYDE